MNIAGAYRERALPGEVPGVRVIHEDGALVVVAVSGSETGWDRGATNVAETVVRAFTAAPLASSRSDAFVDGVRDAADRGQDALIAEWAQHADAMSAAACSLACVRISRSDDGARVGGADGDAALVDAATVGNCVVGVVRAGAWVHRSEPSIVVPQWEAWLPQEQDHLAFAPRDVMLATATTKGREVLRTFGPWPVERGDVVVLTNLRSLGRAFFAAPPWAAAVPAVTSTDAGAPPFGPPQAIVDAVLRANTDAPFHPIVAVEIA